MNLRQLAKKNQELLVEGIANLYVWKEGRSWKCQAFWYDDPANEIYDIEDQKEIDEILKIDRFAVEINGYESIGGDTLNYISWRIKKAYEDQKDYIKSLDKVIKPVDEKEEKFFLTEDVCKQSKFGIRVEKEISNLMNRFDIEDRREMIIKFGEERKEVHINLYYYTVFSCVHDYHTTRKLRELDLKIKKYIEFLIDFRDQIIDQLENKEVKFKYTYRSRGYSPGCQPQYGLVDVKDDIGFKFEVLTYSRKLTDKELYEYELKSLN